MAGLLAAERQALGTIARVALGATAGFLRGIGDAVSTAHRLEMALTPALDGARRGGREASMVGLRGEYAVARSEAIRFGFDALSMPLSIEAGNGHGDLGAASVAAKEIADLYQKRATTALERTEGGSVSARSALPVYAIAEKAATQTAEAFADERIRAEQRLVHRHAGTNWLPALVKLWDATIDRKTCATCREMDGQFRVLGFDFSGGRKPAFVHRKCRCAQVLIFSPIYLGRDEKSVA
ncbi:hypothetical protein WMF38_57530 [Sorangium sp. So ce118]